MGIRCLVFVCTLVAITASSRAGLSQAPSGSANEPTQAPPSGDKKDAAREQFEVGVKLLKEGAWSAALAAFLKSRELYPTRAATNNAAIALRKLERYDESLDMFERLVREFSDLPADDKTAALKAIAELRALVGTVDVQGAEPGSAIAVDGRARGDFPLLDPLRVAAGAHVVRVYKEGFEPFEQRVDVAGGQSVTVVAKLRALRQSGRLKVTEAGGKPLDVVVDGVVVGKAPWEGAVAPGDHTVLLRGDGDVGTQPAAAPVRANQVTPLTLRAESLGAALRVSSTPAGATVAIDSVVAGRGIWEGRLRVGAHRIEVGAEGFLPETRQVSLAQGDRHNLTFSLQRDPDSPLWKRPSRVTVEASTALGIIPTFGGGVAGNCSGECSGGIGVGFLGLAHAGYELPSGIGFGIALGGLVASQGLDGREASIQPVGLPAQTGAAQDTLTLSGFLAGATVGLHVGERFPIHARVGAGVMLGSISDKRSGAFSKATGEGDYDVIVKQSHAARFFYVDPEIKIGLRPIDKVEVAFGVQALMLLALEQGVWDDQQTVNASSDGFATFSADELTGGFVFAIAPGLSARYEF